VPESELGGGVGLENGPLLVTGAPESTSLSLFRSLPLGTFGSVALGSA
jgi:hypothetical protein